MSDVRETARLLLELADDVPRAKGLLHRAARMLVTQGTLQESDPYRCRRCGTPIEQKRMGRPRQFCSDRCRNAAASGRLPAAPPAVAPQRGTTYQTVHGGVKRIRGKASDHSCEHCGEPARDWAYNHVAAGTELVDDMTGRSYSLDPADYIPLCRPCHLRFDRP